ncbi:MAG TPA: DUF1428 family protein [Flavobacteriaceae bacterium]|nr:DUF1428 family protein [Flavobacteriaceae bacterium]
MWKEHGAITYKEFVGDEMSLEETLSFIESIKAKNDEIIIFGYIVFPSKEIRNLANKKVAQDIRMEE